MSQQYIVTCPRCSAKLPVPPGAPGVTCGACGHGFPVIIPATPQPVAPALPYAPPGIPTASAVSMPPAAPPAGVPPAMAPPAGRKKALLIGINYNGQRSQLQGCTNDVNMMKYLLQTKFGFQENMMVILRDDHGTAPPFVPTRANILNAMYWLTADARPGDSLLFHYSGHGGQKRDYSGDEVDGFDETLLPVDYQRAGQIVDDDVNRILVNTLSPGARLHAVIDACHSGTVLDLPFLSRGRDMYGRWTWEDHRSRRTHKGTAGGEAICFSGCADNQVSVTQNSLSRGVSAGAMTYAFIQTIEHGQGQTYASLMTGMYNVLKRPQGQISSSSGFSFLMMGSGRGFAQNPTITSSGPFDLNRAFIL